MHRFEWILTRTWDEINFIHRYTENCQRTRETGGKIRPTDKNTWHGNLMESGGEWICLTVTAQISFSSRDLFLGENQTKPNDLV